MPAAVALGFAADRLLADPRRWHPVAGFGRLATALEARLWRPSRVAGCVFAAILTGSAAAAVAVADRGLRGRRRLRAVFEAVTVWTCLGGRSLETAALELAAAVEAGDVEHARRLAPALVGRDPAGLDAPALLRAAIESVAENTSDAVVGTLVWATALGPAGAAAHRAINTLDAMVGHRVERYAEFGWGAARADDVANWPAARLTALAALSASRRVGALGHAAREARPHPSPNAGLVEAAFAHGLGTRLGGPTLYAHGIEVRPVFAAGPEATPGDVGRAVRLALRTQLSCLAVVLLAAGVSRR
jgi:adenosylcobinamide-phosphate synthase